ncbi:MAG: response regulator transcription factor [Acidobacteria bacterium]|nr:response regulator transcription factor [Acidobacteriota bacterium]
MRSQILIVDDDADLCSIVRNHLEPEGFAWYCVSQRKQALAHVTTGLYSLVLLDVALPEIDGFELLRGLRAHSQTPVLIVTSLANDADRIQGLELGADDYLLKPCNPRELVARVHAILRRAKQPSPQPSKPIHNDRIRAGDIELDPLARLVRCRKELIETTPAEFDLLASLARSAGSNVSREELSIAINGRKFDPSDRSIDMHVCNLRKKLGPGLDGLDRIRTVRGVGYFLACVTDG